MAIVKTWKTYFGGEPFTVRVNVLKSGWFRIQLPGAAHEALGLTYVEADTMVKAMEAFEKQKNRYAGLLQSERRVIRYIFTIQNRKTRYDPDNLGRNDMHFGIGTGLRLGVANAMETMHKSSSGDERRRSYKLDYEQPYPDTYRYASHGGLATEEDCHTIDWTPEREAWFLKFCAALDSLIAQVRALDEDEGKLLEAVSNRLMLGVSADTGG
jgi:hypothetical protein